MDKKRIIQCGKNGFATGAACIYIMYIMAVVSDIITGSTLSQATLHNDAMSRCPLLFLIWFSFGPIAAILGMIGEYIRQRKNPIKATKTNFIKIK